MIFISVACLKIDKIISIVIAVDNKTPLLVFAKRSERVKSRSKKRRVTIIGIIPHTVGSINRIMRVVASQRTNTINSVGRKFL